MNTTMNLKLCEIFFFMAEKENVLEKAKQKLYKIKGYHPFKAYTRIDRTDSEFVKSFDIQKFCNQKLPYGVDKLTEFDCNFIIR